MLNWLRIIVSCFCLALGMLLAMMWVRSYWRFDKVYKRHNNNAFTHVSSNNGTVHISNLILPGPPRPPDSWRVRSKDATGWSPPFQLTFSPDIQIYIPYPSLVLPILAVAVVPWLHLSNRFSLRTLLIAMTVIAVAIVFATYLAR